MKKRYTLLMSLIVGAILVGNQVPVEAIFDYNDGSISAGGSNNGGLNQVKQEISLGGDAVGTDEAHKSGFARVRLDMLNGKLSLVKNSDYDFHKFYDNEKYVSILISDEKGKVLYDKSWNGNESITDLAKGKLGEFASYQLAEGSTVEIYHAEGDKHRFHTNNDAELKNKKIAMTYNYTVKAGQLQLIDNSSLFGNTGEPKSASEITGQNLDFKIYEDVNNGYTNKTKIQQLIETDDSYVFIMEVASHKDQMPLTRVTDYYLKSENGATFKPRGSYGLTWTNSIALFYSKDKDIVGKAKVRFLEQVKLYNGTWVYQDVKVEFDTGIPLEKETSDSVVLYRDYNNKEVRVIHNQYPIDVPKMERFNDDISSVKLPASTSITMWTSNDFTGSSITYKNDTDKAQSYNLGSVLNDKVSSYKIYDNSVKLYNDYDADGIAVTHRERYLSVPYVGDADNDRISSVQLPPQSTIILYADADHTGQTQIITNTTSYSKVFNVSQEMNNKTSSFDFFRESRKGVYDKKMTTIQNNWYGSWMALDWDQSKKDQIIQYTINGGENQKWLFLYDASDETYRIKSAANQEIFLTAGLYFNNDGSINVTTSGAKGHRPYADKWRLIKVGTEKNNGDIFVFRNVETGRVLNTPGGWPLLDYNVRLFPRTHDNINQHYLIHV